MIYTSWPLQTQFTEPTLCFQNLEQLDMFDSIKFLKILCVCARARESLLHFFTVYFHVCSFVNYLYHLKVNNFQGVVPNIMGRYKKNMLALDCGNSVYWCKILAFLFPPSLTQ